MSPISRDLRISKEKMAEISEEELEDILKDLPAHEIYTELNEKFENEPRLARHCKKMWTFKNNNEEMKNLCKRIAYNLEKLSGILSENKNDVRCSYFNHWMYNEIWKLVGTESNYEIDEDAILRLADIGHDINKELSRPYCSYKYYENDKFSEWKEMKNLHDYFKNFDHIKKYIESDGDKYKNYSKYIKYISKIYRNYEDECCDPALETREFSPIYFKCDEEYHPKKLLALLERNNATSGDQPQEKSLKELNTQEEASNHYTLEIQNPSDISSATTLNHLKKEEFQTPDQSVITNGEGSQNYALASIQNPVNNSCQNVDRLEDNLGNMNCRSQETSNVTDKEYFQENIEQVSDSLQASTEQIKDERRIMDDTEGRIAEELTSLTLQVDGHSGQRRNTNVHESRSSSREVPNGHTKLPYKDSGNGYTDSSDIIGQEHNLFDSFGSNFSSILDILKNNLLSISIVSSASIGLIILLLVYFKFRRRKTGLRRKREEMNNNYYTYGEEGIPELLGYSQNFAYSNPDNRQIPIFYSYA
ncbi:VIR protein [Plasmodium vivax]|uniref:VIR protein n=1 Tax=Plasmodium vivax TaxID=5855 RepID=A0A1G4EBA1_PLAVI|nr:VIR protein [Plasmodium vivax]